MFCHSLKYWHGVHPCVGSSTERSRGMDPQGKHSFPKSISSPSCSSAVSFVSLGAVSPFFIILYSLFTQIPSPSAPSCDWHSSHLGLGYPWVCPWSPEELCLHPRAQLALEQAEELGQYLGTADVIPYSWSEIKNQFFLGVARPGPPSWR